MARLCEKCMTCHDIDEPCKVYTKEERKKRRKQILANAKRISRETEEAHKRAAKSKLRFEEAHA